MSDLYSILFSTVNPFLHCPATELHLLPLIYLFYRFPNFFLKGFIENSSITHVTPTANLVCPPLIITCIRNIWFSSLNHLPVSWCCQLVLCFDLVPLRSFTCFSSSFLASGKEESSFRMPSIISCQLDSQPPLAFPLPFFKDDFEFSFVPFLLFSSFTHHRASMQGCPGVSHSQMSVSDRSCEKVTVTSVCQVAFQPVLSSWQSLDSATSFFPSKAETSM